MTQPRQQSTDIGIGFNFKGDNMDSKREEFEKLATERAMNIRRSLVDANDYMTEGTKDAWAAYQAALASLQPAQPAVWSYCPECGCAEWSSSRYAKGQICDNCGQEWFSNVDYTDVILKHIGEWHSDRAASPLPQSALSSVDAQKVRDQALLDALQRLESANNTLCSMRTQAMYDSMLDAGQQDALIELDNARFAARAIIRALQSQSLPSAEGDAEDARRLDALEVALKAGKRLSFHKGHFSLQGFTNYEYEVFKTVRGAIDAAIAHKENK